MKPHLCSISLPRKSLFYLLGAVFLLAFTPFGIMQSGLDGPTEVDNYYNGEFPSLPPGTFIGGSGGGGATRFVDAFPRLTFTDAISFVQAPRSNQIYVASRAGEIVSFDNNPNANSVTNVIDINAAVPNDGGFLSLAFHPDFNNGNRYMYTFYCARGNGGRVYLRLSRFTIGNNGRANPNTELIMVNIRMYGRTHRGCELVFDDDGYLLFSIGDQERLETSQSISNNFEGGIFRIDVDQRPGRSHAVKRKMGQDAGNNDEYTGVGYTIPNDNPWVRGGNNKSVFEEYYAVGSRQPYRMTKDSQTGDIWFSEVGSNKEEEINFLRKGANYQWPYREGKNGAGRAPKPNNPLGTERGPVVSFQRNESSAIVGGYMIRSNFYSNALNGKYICGGYEQDRVFLVTPNGNNTSGSFTQLLTYSPRLLINWGQDANGVIYAMGLGRNKKIWRLQEGNGGGQVVEAERRLSRTGVFKNMNTLEWGDGFIPYEPIAKLYSDGAIKKRAIAIPNNGRRFRANQKIDFTENGDWDLPVGTVVVKHFEINTNKNNPNQIRRLETRVLVVDENKEVYALTYKWDGNEAFLLEDGEEENIRIRQEDGSRETITWQFPSRNQCFQCHTAASQRFLGLKTRHLNSDIEYPSTGKTGNQLETLSTIGALDTELNPNQINNFLTQVAIGDESATLEERARSYLDINCSSCHRPGTSVRANFDLRYTTALEDQNLIDEDPFENLGVNNAKIIKPGEPDESILYLRMNSVDPCCKMPQVGRSTVHGEAVEVVREWIERLGGPPPPPVIPGDYYDAIEDAYVSSKNTGTNYGGRDEMRIRANSGNNFIGYAKFDIGKRVFVEKATLRLLMNRDSETIRVRTFEVGNDWDEFEIDYENAPRKADRLGNPELFPDIGYADIDVTDYATQVLFGDGVISFYMESSSETNAFGRLGTKENGNPIQLILETRPGEPNFAPVASFTANPESGSAPLEVDFNANASSDEDGEIVSYAYDFGDGNSSTQKNPTHTYTELGTYTVTLVVTDDKGAQSEATRTITVSNSPPKARITADPLSGPIDLTVNFDASASTDNDGTIESYSWDFGDGTTGEGLSVTHTYTAVGIYEVSLIVTDNWGEEDRTAVDINAQERPNELPVAIINADRLSGIIDLTINFDGSSSRDSDGSIVKYEWDFGDGNRAEGAQVTHTYTAVNTYTLTLVVTDDDGAKHQATAKINALRVPNVPPIANIEVNADKGPIDFTVNFDGSKSTDSDGIIVKYEWDLGNGETAEGALVDYTYTEIGTYIVWLTVTDNEGATHRTSIEIEAHIPPNILPVASISADPVEGTVPLLVNFDGSGSSDPDGTIVGYLWDFGDSNFGDGESTSHTYEKPGTYFAKLTITDDRDGTDTKTVEILVRPKDLEPNAVIFAAPLQGKVPLLVSFNAADSFDEGGEIVSYLWDFGDGGKAGTAITSHPYFTEGLYTVTLTVTDNDGRQNTAVIEVDAWPENFLPVAEIDPDTTTGNAPAIINFDASASSDRDGTIESYYWDFGDGNTATGVNPSHQFEQGGNFDVWLIVTDDKGGVDSVSVQIELNSPPVPDLFASHESGDLPLAVLFDASGSKDTDGEIVSYVWDFGDGTTSTEVAPSYEYTEEGVYNVSLTLTDEDGAVSVAYHQIEVGYPSAPSQAIPAMEVARTSRKFPMVNYGREPSMMLKADPASRAFVKFDLSEVGGRIHSAYLRVYKRRTGRSYMVVETSDDGWKEMQITYNNAPNGPSRNLGAIEAKEDIGYYDIYLSSYVQQEVDGDKILSLVINGPSDGSQVDLFSDEGLYPPLLVINEGIVEERKGRFLENKPTITVFPNPFEDAFELDLSIEWQTGNKLVLELLDQSGKRIQKWKFATKDKIVLQPKNDLPQGVYYIVAKSGKLEEQLKIIKH